MDHTLIVLPKATEEAGTVSGKCSCGGARFNAGSQREVEEQYQAHRAEVATGNAETDAG